MTSDDPRPPPLTPPDADLRKYPDMMLNVMRLRDSDLAMVESPEVFRAAVLSWCVSWHQVPAGSLPNDDGELSSLLRYGTRTDRRKWLAIRRAGGLRGWIECSDGRLYHPVVAAVVHRTLARMSKDRVPKVAKEDETPIPSIGSNSQNDEEVVRTKRWGDSPPESGDLFSDNPLETNETQSAKISKEVREIVTPISPLVLTPETMPPDGGVCVGDLGGDPNQVLWDILGVWNAMAGPAGLPQVRELSRPRMAALRQRIRDRWRRDPVAQFRAYCDRISTSPFLTGQLPGATWRATFDWAIKPTTIAKVIEGQYHGGEAWEEV